MLCPYFEKFLNIILYLDLKHNYLELYRFGRNNSRENKTAKKNMTLPQFRKEMKKWFTSSFRLTPLYRMLEIKTGHLVRASDQSIIDRKGILMKILLVAGSNTIFYHKQAYSYK